MQTGAAVRRNQWFGTGTFPEPSSLFAFLCFWLGIFAVWMTPNNVSTMK